MSPSPSGQCNCLHYGGRSGGFGRHSPSSSCRRIRINSLSCGEHDRAHRSVVGGCITFSAIIRLVPTCTNCPAVSFAQYRVKWISLTSLLGRVVQFLDMFIRLTYPSHVPSSSVSLFKKGGRCCSTLVCNFTSLSQTFLKVFLSFSLSASFSAVCSERSLVG